MAILSKKFESLGRENSSLKYEITKLNSDLKLAEAYRQQGEELQGAVFEREQRISELLRANEKLVEEVQVRQRLVEELNHEVGKAQQIYWQAGDENAFNMAIRASLEEYQRLKERVSEKDQEIDHVRELNKQLRTQVDSLRNEGEITKLKYMAEIKNIETNFEIEKQALQNQVSSFEKMVTVLDEKFKFLLKEEKKKDEFMVAYFKGKTADPKDRDLIANFFRQFEEVPKITMSELIKQELQVQDGLRDEIAKLREDTHIKEVLIGDLRKQITDLILQRPTYY